MIDTWRDNFHPSVFEDLIRVTYRNHAFFLALLIKVRETYGLNDAKSAITPQYSFLLSSHRKFLYFLNSTEKLS